MTTLGRVKGWQGRMHHQGYKMSQLRQVDDVRLQRAFNLEASRQGIAQAKIQLGIDGMVEALEAGLSSDAAEAIAWALTRDAPPADIDKIIADNIPDELKEHLEELAAQESGTGDGGESENKAPEAEAEKEPEAEAATQPAKVPAKAPAATAEKPAKATPSKAKDVAKKAAKKAEKIAAAEPEATAVANVAPAAAPAITEADLAAVEVENPYDDLGGVG